MSFEKKILIYYGVFFSSFCVAVIPFTVASVFALMICSCILAAIYIERAKSDQGTLLYNHMTFLIRSFWRGNFYLLMCLSLALIYILLTANYETFGICIDAILSAINTGRFGKVGSLVHACEILFLEENANHLKTAAVIAFAPIVVYLLFRCVYGWMHGKHKKLIPEKKL